MKVINLIFMDIIRNSALWIIYKFTNIYEWAGSSSVFVFQNFIDSLNDTFFRQVFECILSFKYFRFLMQKSFVEVMQMLHERQSWGNIIFKGVSSFFKRYIYIKSILQSAYPLRQWFFLGFFLALMAKILIIKY